MLLLLEESATAYLDKYCDQFFAAIKACLSDATAGVRSTARKCFCASLRHWRDKARKLFSTLDPSTQKAINEEEQKYDRSNNTDENIDPITISRPKSSQSNRSRPNGASSLNNTLKNRSLADNVANIQKSKSNVLLNYEAQSVLDAVTEQNFIITKPTKPTTAPVKKSSASFSISAAKKAWMAKRKPVRPDDGTITDVVVTHAQGHVVAPSNRDEEDDEIFKEVQDYYPLMVGSSSTIPTLQIGYNTYQSQTQAQQQNIQSCSNGYANGINKQTSTTQAQDRSVPTRSRPTNDVNNTTMNSSVKKLSPSKKLGINNVNTLIDPSNGPVIVLPNETVVTILRDARALLSTNSNGTAGLPTTTCKLGEQPWTDRVLCCEKLIYLVQSRDRWSELNPRFHDVMMVLLDKYVIDPHYKVVLRCLALMNAMVPKYQLAFEPYLERVFGKIFLRLTDPKEVLRQSTEQLLLTIANNYSGDTLLPTLLKVTDNNNAKIKLACIEYMLHIIPNSSSYLTYPSHMKLCMMKLNAQLATTGKVSSTISVDAAAIAALVSLYMVHPRIFLEQVLLLPMTEQAAIKSVMSNKHPDFDNELATVSKGARSSMGASSQRNNGGGSTLNESVSNELDMTDASNGSRPQSMKTDDLLLLPPMIAKRKLQNATPANQATQHDSKLPRYNTKLVITNDSEDLSSLLNLLNRHTQESNFEAMRNDLVQLRSVSQYHDDSEEMWKISLPKTLFAVLELIYHTDDHVREEALYLMKSLLQYHSMRFVETTMHEITFKRILSKYMDPVKAVYVAAEKAAEMYVQAIDHVKTLDALRSALLNANKEKEAMTLGALRLLRLLIASSRTQAESSLTPEVLQSQVSSLLPVLTEAFNHTNADIRKAVVYCLAEMMLILGDHFQPYLKRLSQSQAKLVMVYYQQMKTTLHARSERVNGTQDDMVT